MDNTALIPDNLGLTQLDLTSEEYLLDEIEECIQANLEDEIVKDALKKGVDLRQYSKQVESELTVYENASIEDYIKESQNIARLHKQIVSCDSVLGRIEDMLKDFQQHLSSISSDIQSLQQQSVEMNVQLKNKQAVRSELCQYVDEMVVPEVMISHILDTAVTEREFVEQLHELNHKINFVKEQSFRDARACHDVRDILDKLRWKAVEKIREFLLDKVYQFRKPLTNYQIPQNIMLKHGFFNEFLMAHERQVAKEIKDEYVDTTSKIYYSYFKGYVTRLVKLQLDDVADKDELMGADDTSKRGFFSSKPTLKNKGTIFSLGSRDVVLGADLEAPAIIPHAAQKNEQRFALETLFRSHQFALLDNACHEYFFISDFYLASGTAAMELFNLIFGRTLAMFQKLLEQQVMESYDSIGLFLCLHITLKYRTLMNKRSVPALDKYWETVQELIGPRLEYLLQLHIISVKECDVQKLGHIDSRPHYIPRRYAEFAAAFLSINDSEPSERIGELMSRLQHEVDSFINRLAREFPNRKQQLIFLINNYDMIVATISEKVTTENRDLENLKGQLTSKIQEYVDEILTPNFGALMSFVKEVEAVMESGGQVDMSRYERRVTQLVKSFNADWKKAIDQMSQELMMSFVNFKNGQQILQTSLTQMIQYYHRFQQILGQPPFKALPVRNEAINIHQVMVEVKKHKATF